MFVHVRARPRTRFCIGVTLAGTASFLSVLTFVQKDWIEILFGAAAGDVGRGLPPSGGR
jgi:hypothetical protein